MNHAKAASLYKNKDERFNTDQYKISFLLNFGLDIESNLAVNCCFARFKRHKERENEGFWKGESFTI